MTPFSQAWEKYQRSEKFTELKATLNKAGIKDPYASNCIWWAFEAGYTARPGPGRPRKTLNHKKE
jgi:hypothetical protein